MAAFKKKYSDVNFEYFYKESETEQKEDVSHYTKIYESRKTLTIVLGKAGNISVGKQSFLKIFSMSESSPEEQILFTYYNPLESEPHQEANKELATLNEIISNQNNIMVTNFQEEKQNNIIDTISPPKDNTEIQVETKSNIYVRFFLIFRFSFLVIFIFGLLNIIYFASNSDKHKKITTFEIETVICGILCLTIGALGSFTVKNVDDTRLVLGYIVLSILLTITHFCFGITTNQGKPFWLVYTCNIILIIYEILMIVVYLIIKKKYRSINERLLEVDIESQNILPSENTCNE